MRRRELLQTSSGGSQTFTLSLSPNYRSVTYVSGSTTFKVMADGITYSGDSDVILTVTSGYFVKTAIENGKVTVIYTANGNSATTRSSTIKVSLFGRTAEFTLVQAKNTSRGTVDGYEYVDLGLPKGLLWAIKDVGSNHEYGSGTSVVWSASTASSESMGGGWRLPTSAETAALINNLTFSRDTLLNVFYTGKSNKTGGEIKFGVYKKDGHDTSWWTSTSKDSDNAYALSSVNSALTTNTKVKTERHLVRCVHPKIT